MIGIPDTLLGEAIRAYVSLKKDVTLNDNVIKSHCLEKLENIMVPKEIVFLAEHPKTITGKIQK